jgi:hypothetical protein
VASCKIMCGSNVCGIEGRDYFSNLCASPYVVFRGNMLLMLVLCVPKHYSDDYVVSSDIHRAHLDCCESFCKALPYV